MLGKFFSINLFVIILFIIDRLAKIYFFKNPSVIYGGDFFSGLISWHYVTNTGIAFGLKINQLVIFIIIILILVWLIKLLLDGYYDKNLLNIFSLSLIMVGAMSNLIDRFKYGFVIDYIDLRWFTVFNLADTMITVGILIMALDIFIFSKTRQKRIDSVR